MWPPNGSASANNILCQNYLPQCVTDAKAALLEIPRDFQAAYIPKDNLTVNNFIRTKLPTQSAELWPIKATDCYSPNFPTVGWDTLAYHSIPSPQMLRALEDSLGQAWFDGARSIIDWRYNDGQEYIPFWAVSYWRRIGVIITKQTIWLRAVRWVEKNLRSSQPPDDEMDKALETVYPMFDHLPWNGPLPYLRRNVTTVDLAPFLGTNWLNDDHINMMVEDLNSRVSVDETLRGKVIIAPLVFAHNLRVQQLTKGYIEKPKYLDRIIQMVTSNRLERLYFPVNINENHWITAYINFDKHVFGYGKLITHTDSYSNSRCCRRLVVKHI